MITEKKRVPVYLTEECYQMMDENRRKHSDMDDSEYLEMLIHDNPIDDLEKYDEKILEAVQNVLSSRDRLQGMLSRENLKDNKAIKACVKSIEDNAERFREYFLLKCNDAYGIKEDS